MADIKGTLEEVQRSRGQLCFEWRIERFFSLVHLNHVESPRFLLNDSSWSLSVFPNREWLQLFLYRVDDGSSVTFTVAVSVMGPRGEAHKEEWRDMFYQDECFVQVWNQTSAPKMNALRRRLLQHRALVLRCHIKIDDGDVRPRISLETTNEGVTSSGKRDAGTQTSFEATNEGLESSGKKAVDEVLGSLQSLYKNSEGCDVVLKVQGKEFPSHKLILQMRSPVFRAMFDHNMLEKQRNSATLEDCDLVTFPAFLEHLYTGGVGMISGGNVFALYSAADKYGLEALKGACAEFLKKNLNVASFCRTVALSVRHEERELTELATRFFCDHTLDIVQTPEWKTFLAENLTVGNELFIKLLKK